MNRFEIYHHEQERSYSCGPASLKIAYRFLGLEYTEEMLEQEMKVDPQKGTDWIQLFEHASLMGFRASLKSNATVDDLRKDKEKGVIVVSWATDVNGYPQGHYSVLSDISSGLIELIDPGLPLDDNPHIMPIDEFAPKWHIEEPHNSYLLIQ